MTQITLLDGSIGQELVRRSGKPATPLWSTSVMIEQPELVAALHRDYFAAGATVATTNTYALHPNFLDDIDLPDPLDTLADIAVKQAVAARDANGSGRVAGSLGPYLASYRPDLDPDPGEAADWFAARVARFGDRVDILLAETVSSLREAEGVLRGMEGAALPRWISFTTADEDGTRLRSGESVRDLGPLLERHAPDAVLVNCTRPEVVGDALDALASTDSSGKRTLGAYANGFKEIAEEFLEDKPTVDVLKTREDLGPSAYADIAMTWIDRGATILGGCCEIGPAHIAELAGRLRASGREIA